jgi:hypothetical protein
MWIRKSGISTSTARCLVRHHGPVLAFPSAQTNLVLLHSYFYCHSRLHTRIPHPANPRAFFESRPVPKGGTNFEPCGKGFGEFLRGSENPHNFRCIIGSAQRLHRPGSCSSSGLDSCLQYKKSRPSLVLSLSAYISSDLDPC